MKENGLKGNRCIKDNRNILRARGFFEKSQYVVITVIFQMCREGTPVSGYIQVNSGTTFAL